MSVLGENPLENLFEIDEENKKIEVKISEKQERYPVIMPGENIELHLKEKKITSRRLLASNCVLDYQLLHEAPRKHIDINLREDEIKAYLDIKLKPAIKYEISLNEIREGIKIEGKQVNSKVPELTKKDITSELAEAGIFYGIKREKIADIAAKNSGCEGELIAEGKKPIPGESASINRIVPERVKKQNKNSREKIDHYQNIIFSVLPGEIIAEKKGPTEGKPGKSVTGKMIPAQDGEDIELEAEEGAQLSDDGHKVIALISGRPEFKEDKEGLKARVVSRYLIAGDIDKSEGNVEFAGDLKVTGSIQDYFGAIAEKNISVKKQINNAEIKAGGDIFVGGSIAGAKLYAGLLNFKGEHEKLEIGNALQDLYSFFLTNADNLVKKLEKEESAHLEIRKLILENRSVRKSIKQINSLWKKYEKEDRKLPASLPLTGKEIKWLHDFVFGDMLLDKDKTRDQFINIVDNLKNWAAAENNGQGNIVVRQAQNSSLTAAEDVVILGEGSYTSTIKAGKNIIVRQKNAFFKSGQANAQRWFVSGCAGTPMSQTTIRVGEGIIVNRVKGPIIVGTWNDKKTIAPQKTTLYLQVNEEGKLQEKSFSKWRNMVAKKIDKELISAWKSL